VDREESVLEDHRTGPSLSPESLLRAAPSSLWRGSAADWPALVFPVEAVCIATLQRQISDKFLAKLAESKDVDVGKIAQLKNLWSPDGVLAKHRHRTRSSGNVL